MLKEAVDKLLAGHRENVGRCKHVEAEIIRLKAMLKDAEANYALDMIHAHNYELSGMPHGTQVGNPTERIAMKLAGGWEPEYMDEYRRQLEAYEAEWKQRNLNKLFVEGWLSGLPERERWLVETQVIDGVFWRDVLIRYKQKFGTDASKDTLQRVKAKALERIYEMAK